MEIIKFKNKILDILFPHACQLCETHIDQAGLCNNCWIKIEFIGNNRCYICGMPLIQVRSHKELCGICILNKPAYDRAFSVFVYNEHSKDLIHKLKYNDKTYLTEIFADWFLRIIPEINDQIDYVIAVPIHKIKLLKRGYNQASLLARKLSAKTKLYYLPNCLEKTINTISQSGLRKQDRAKNIKKSFKINESLIDKIKGKNLLLIDDVLTTGATINACSRILKKNGVNKIYVLTVGRTSL